VQYVRPTLQSQPPEAHSPGAQEPICHSLSANSRPTSPPVPGAPYSSTPRGGSMPIWRYSSWCVSGSSTASRISCFWMSRPPMSCSGAGPQHVHMLLGPALGMNAATEWHASPRYQYEPAHSSTQRGG
jgi:hypothetical protein